MIELSADLGESGDVERHIWPLIHAGNIACGGHTGDETSMQTAVDLAAKYGAIVGAHPSYPDRENFGRKTMVIERGRLRDSLVEQIESLRKLAKVERVKPHGALYNDAHRDRALADVIVEAIQKVDPHLALVASDTSQMAAAARAVGIGVIREAFGDRGYRPDGSLIPRGQPGALLSVEEAAHQAEKLASGELGIAFDTLCIHSDMENAVERLKAIRQKLLPFSPPRGEKVPRSGG